MAANFWTSSHCKQLLDSEDLNVVHQLDRERGLTLEDCKLIKIHMSNYISRLAQNVKVRQRVVATAITYMRRVYVRLLQDAGMSDATQLTWGIVNDTYKMDLILIHPPHLIALACIYIASVLKDRENSTSWFEELRADMNVVKNIAMEILDFYDSHKMITDERVNAAMSKLPG
ncbi:unnamed protein product [Cuscuta epithymum]|uniref:Cyclin-like domain-containing protein n=1 Tax=Cuscuta epithymum TaxID=186058 RepID=A0AAV0FYB8_9ASTE|nr:unnamed protein product [Cuscuta epithymum]